MPQMSLQTWRLQLRADGSGVIAAVWPVVEDEQTTYYAKTTLVSDLEVSV